MAAGSRLLASLWSSSSTFPKLYVFIQSDVSLGMSFFSQPFPFLDGAFNTAFCYLSDGVHKNVSRPFAWVLWQHQQGSFCHWVVSEEYRLTLPLFPIIPYFGGIFFFLKKKKSFLFFPLGSRKLRASHHPLPSPHVLCLLSCPFPCPLTPGWGL